MHPYVKTGLIAIAAYAVTAMAVSMLPVPAAVAKYLPKAS